MQKYTLTTIKSIVDKNISSTMNPQEFINKYIKFLGEVQDDFKMIKRQIFKQDDYKFDEDFGTYYMELPNDLYSVESIKIASNKFDGSKDWRNVNKTSTTNLFTKTNIGYEDEYEYLIEDKKIFFPYLKKQNSKNEVMVFYHYSLIESFGEELVNLGKDLNDVTGINLDDLNYALDNEYIDIATLYISYQHYLERKVVDFANYFYGLYQVKFNEYKTKIISNRAKNQRSHVVIERNLY